MSTFTASQLARALAAYRGVSRERLRIVLHGGEPLLAGKTYMEELLSIFVETLSNQITIAVHTNGLLLDEEWVKIFDRWGVKLSLSLDGPADVHDRSRVNFDGIGSHAKVVAAVQMLLSSEAGRRIFAGTVGVVDLRCEPERFYTHVRSLGIRSLDVLLPDSHWATPPPLPVQRVVASYGEWLCRLFDSWFTENNPAVSVGFCSASLECLIGKRGVHEFWGLAPLGVAVIDADGSLEVHDSFRVVGEGYGKPGYNIHRDSIEAFEDTPLMKRLLQPEDHLSTECGTCHWRDVCGGGLPSHRYNPETGLNTPSVYCGDIQRYLGHLQSVLGVYTLS